MIARILLWLQPYILRIYERYGISFQVDLPDPQPSFPAQSVPMPPMPVHTHAPGAHTAHHAITRSIPGAHIWVYVFILASALTAHAAPDPLNVIRNVFGLPQAGAAGGSAGRYDSSGYLYVNVGAGGGAGGTSSSFGAAFPATGTAMGAKLGANMSYLTLDGSNYLYVNCATGCSGGATTPTDAFATPTTAGLSTSFSMGYNGSSWDLLRSGDKNNVAAVTGVLNVLGIGRYNATQPTLTDGRFNALQLGAKGSLEVTNGAEGFTIAALPTGSNVIGHIIADTGSTTAVTQATGTNLHAVLDTTSTTAVTQATGTNLHAVLDANSGVDIGKLTANQSVNLTQVAGGTAINAGVTGSLAVGGCVATNVATPCSPLNLGAQAVSSENSAATTAREVQLVADLVGKLIVLPYANPENFVNGTTAAITDTTSTSIIGSAGGSLRNYITSVIVTNSHATVGTFVKILEGSNIIWEGYAAAAGGGFTSAFPVALKGAAATAINCQPVTTGANVICSAQGYKGL